MSARGIVRPARRPAGWIAPGPPPAGPQGRPELEPAADEDLCFLAGDWRLFQKQRGHRWSLDDLVTAWIATRAAPQATRALDLGCGLASVLLVVAWRLPNADVTGIEAQADRAAMGRRSIAYNGVAARCRILDGDLRATSGLGAFDLITGTPPYFPRGTGTESTKAHALPCRFEVRGGVEDYLRAAAGLLAPGAPFVMCSSARERDRVRAGCAAAGLAVVEHWEIIPKAGKPALVCVDVVVPARGPERAPPTPGTLVVRDERGAWTAEMRQVRADLGMPPVPA
jgi:tRNA1(Val) A37 N6-methylase TrmN6